jgi:hypothetical protein
VPALPPNYIARPYRGVSVARWDEPLEPAAVARILVGREAYRRTEFIVLRAAGGTALVRVAKVSEEPLFSPITAVEWLAGPEECDDSVAPDVDTGIASDMARAARHRPPGKRVYVVEGLHHHVNFIVEPQAVRIRVPEVIPPEPPKLYEMARKVLSVDEELPPIELVFEPIDIRAIAATVGPASFLLPCRTSGIELPGRVDFLDERPTPPKPEWVLIGCERSRQLYRWFYRTEPDRRELCPKVLSPENDSGDGPVLLKCCLLERGIETAPGRAVVPWGATLAEVRQALAFLAEPSNLLITRAG